MGVPINSSSCNGNVSFNTLKKHIYYSDILKDAIPYNWTGLYRPNKNQWGFCMPKKEFLKLKKGIYKVEIKTKEEKFPMKVLEYVMEILVKLFKPMKTV